MRRIKPHAPPLVRAPVNSFEFQPCGRTPQAGYLLRLLRHRGGSIPPTPSIHRLQPGLPGYLIPFAPPGFRSSASGLGQKGAFATGVPPDIYAFHRYTRNSPFLSYPQEAQYLRSGSPVKPMDLLPRLRPPPTSSLRPVIPDNACSLRLTAAAGTESAGASSAGTVICFFPTDRTLQPEGPSSFTRRRCVRLSPIAQNSSLLPPVGVWAVSQSQCD